MGRSAEWISCAIQVPTFFCWIGAQYLSIGALLEAYLGLPAWIGILLSSGVVLAILWSGGMWAVTWTNSLMIALSIASVIFLFWSTATRVGDGSVLNGITSVIEHTPSDQLSFVPDMSLPALLSVLGVFLTGLLGNIPGQDLQQRVLSARDPWVARWSCIVSGIIYALLGLIPIYVGLAAKWKLQAGITPEDIAGDRILPIAAAAFLSEPLVILLVVGLLSVNLAVAASSTLSQTTILSSNILAPWWQAQKSTPGLDRACVVIVTAGSLAAAFSGESVMGLLEVSLAIVMVSLFVPMCVCLFGTPSSPWVGVASMVVGVLVWGLHGFVAAWPQVPWLVGYRAIPPEIQGLGASFLAAVVTERVFHRKDR
jgi:solute:Na+ symporter, SSS family